MTIQIAYAWRLLREISLAHLWVPLLFTLIIDTGYGWWAGKIETLSHEALTHYWLEHLPTLLVHYCVFVAVFGALLISRADVSDIDIAILDSILPTATSYLGIGMIPLREWFEPSTTTYLSWLLEYRSRASSRLDYSRILLFFTETDYLATKASYLDAVHAKQFADLHRRWNVPLAFLKQEDCAETIAKLTPTELRDLGWFRSGYLWHIGTLRKLLRSSYIPIRLLVKKPLHKLAFAVVTLSDGQRQVLHFVKEHQNLRLQPMVKEAQATAHVSLAELLVSAVRKADGNVRTEHDFCRLY